jgi:hypothetical protein
MRINSFFTEPVPPSITRVYVVVDPRRPGHNG